MIMLHFYDALEARRLLEPKPPLTKFSGKNFNFQGTYEFKEILYCSAGQINWDKTMEQALSGVQPPLVPIFPWHFADFVEHDPPLIDLSVDLDELESYQVLTTSFFFLGAHSEVTSVEFYLDCKFYIIGLTQYILKRSKLINNLENLYLFS